MAKYWTCPYCGDNLDFGEKCDCQEHAFIQKKAHMRMKNTFINLMEGQDEREN